MNHCLIKEGSGKVRNIYHFKKPWTCVNMGWLLHKGNQDKIVMAKEAFNRKI
jgi:hypothetical protein